MTNMDRRHLILDFETLGTDTQKCAVIDCAYTVFDWKRFTLEPYTFRELVETSTRNKFDVAHQAKELGYKIDPGTLKFWQDQDPKVRKKILPSDEDIKLGEFVDLMFDAAFNIKCWWSRSNSFDPPILWRIAKDHSSFDRLHGRLPHWKVRDTRTFIDAKTNFELKENGFCPVADADAWNNAFEQHNCVHDIAADILRLQTLVRIENDLGWSEIG